MDKTKVPIGGIVLPDSSLSLVWDATRLRLLVEIDRRGSVSAAAKSIGIGQPTASEHLRLLEAAAGQRLVERNGRGSRLTEAGNVLAQHAGQALATLAAGEQELHALAGLETGTIHIGASTTPGCISFRARSAASDATTQTSPSRSRSPPPERSSSASSPGGSSFALVGETLVDERVKLEPFLSDEIVGVARPGLLLSIKARSAPRHSPSRRSSCAKQARAPARSPTER